MSLHPTQHWFESTSDAVLIHVKVIPNAKATQVLGIENHRLKLRLKAKPHDHKANQELIDFFCQILNLNRCQVTLLYGHKSREKSIKAVISAQELMQAIGLS